MESENYYFYWSLYEAVKNAPDVTEAVTQLNTLEDESYFMAKNHTKALFNMKRGDARSMTYNTSDLNKFMTDVERKTRDLVCTRLSEYVKYLEGFRYGRNKIATLYSYLIFEGLLNILGNIYVPEDLRQELDSAVEELRVKSEKVLKVTQEYFLSKKNSDLSRAIISLGPILLTQHIGQIVDLLSSIYEFSDEDRVFLESQRLNYSRFVDNIDHKIIYEKFGISDSSYYRHLNTIVSDLVSRLNENDIELITDLFLKR